MAAERAVIALACVVLTCLLASPAAARTVDRGPRPTPPAQQPPPPLADPSAQGEAGEGVGPLVGNGFGSPACRNGTAATPLARLNCSVSGITVVPEPLDNYRFDIHIDTGPLGQNMDSALQDLLLQPVWSGLVWLVHIAVVAVEWCFSIDLLAPGALAPIAAALQTAHDEFTQPWLAAALCLAALALLYHGLVRRRVAESIGEIALTIAMMAAGLAVIADPQGTVGWAAELANSASLGTVAAISGAGIQDPEQSLDDGLGDTFDTTINGPWCYLEFGDVDWCLQPGRLDPALRATGDAIASLDRNLAACRGVAPAGLPACPTRGSPAQLSLLSAAAGLESARTNGELFLALPADGPQRNSINADAADPSLLRTLCGSDQATACTASTGPQAQFRTEDGTPGRAGGLLLIAIGIAGMLALFGFLALRLLSAAVIAVFLLLLAPAAVLAPALGDGGRDAFRRWSMRLLGAIAAKLVYSIFLGVVLLLLRVLRTMDALGWWTQWLLIVAFWWIVFHHRHRLLEHVLHERRERVRHTSLTSRLLLARAASRFAGRAVSVAQTRLAPAPREPPTGSPMPRRNPRPPRREPSRLSPVPAAPAAAALTLATRMRADRQRLARLREHERTALRSGDSRRVVSLRLRAQQVERDIARGTGELREGSRGGGPRGPLASRRRARRLAAAVAAPRGRRDHAALAPLAGLTRSEYERLAPPAQLRARLAIEREVERRGGATPLVRPRSDRPSPTAPAPRRLGPRERQFGGWR